MDTLSTHFITAMKRSKSMPKSKRHYRNRSSCADPDTCWQLRANCHLCRYLQSQHMS
jgi:hypothetical protein